MLPSAPAAPRYRCRACGRWVARSQAKLVQLRLLGRQPGSYITLPAARYHPYHDNPALPCGPIGEWPFDWDQAQQITRGYN